MLPKRGLLGDRRGLSTVEYVLVLVLIASIALATWRLFGQRVVDRLSGVSDQIADLGGSLDGDFSLEGSSGPSATPAASAASSGTSPAAPAGSGTSPAAPSPAAAAAKQLALAQALVTTQGKATAADAAAVARELAKLPEPALKALKANGTKVVVVDQSVLQASPQLATGTPRGWPAGSQWQTVPGVYDNSAKNQVVIVVNNGTIPPTGAGHNSTNLVLHETAHAIQAALERPFPSEGGSMRSPPTAGAKDPAFLNARQADLATLPPYQTQAGTAGIDETYAESMASYYQNPAGMKTAQPNLYQYWSTHPPGGK
jgi:Flp pilus assembly pilin Flp